MASTTRRPRTRPKRRPAKRRPATRRTTARTRLRRTTWPQRLTALVALALAVTTWPQYAAIVAVTLLSSALISLTVLALWNRRTLEPRATASRAHTIAGFLALDHAQFEHAVAGLARSAPDCTSATVQGGANDRALDVLVRLTDGRRIMVQCKRYAPTKAVDADTVYSVNGTYREWHGASAAVIVTTSRYTASAREFANRVGVRLIDGPALESWANGGPPPWA